MNEPLCTTVHDQSITESGKINLICKGKNHCTADLLFYLTRSICFVYFEYATDLLVWSNPNQSNRGSSLYDFYPNKVSEYSLAELRFLLTFTIHKLQQKFSLVTAASVVR